ncbi:MAG: hypothetical protein ABSG75_07635 [Syntrophales bacterium]|jgi:hypothetical protein
MANNDHKSLLKHIRINIQRYIHLDLAPSTAFYKSSYNLRTEAISNHPAAQKTIDIYSPKELLKKLNVRAFTSRVDIKELISSVLKAKGEGLCVADLKV